MLIEVLKCKIHRATVTADEVDYEGSITIDSSLMDLAGLVPYEKVAVWNVTNGNRFETYVIEGAAGGGDMCVNGAAGHLAKRGDIIIVAAFAQIEAGEQVRPRTIRVDEQNRPLQDTSPETAP